MYDSCYGCAETLFAGKTLPCPGRLYPAAVAEPYEWPGGLRLLLCGDIENQPAEDLTASGVPSTGRNRSCAARWQMDALPARGPALARGRGDSRANPTRPGQAQKVCGPPRAHGAGVRPAI